MMETEGINEIDVASALRRADQAKGILENPIFLDAFEAMNKQLYEAFRTVNTTDTDALSHIRLTQSILDNVKDHIISHITTGQNVKLAFIEQQEDKVI